MATTIKVSVSCANRVLHLLDPVARLPQSATRTHQLGQGMVAEPARHPGYAPCFLARHCSSLHNLHKRPNVPAQSQNRTVSPAQLIRTGGS